MGEALKGLLAERDIGFHSEQTTERIDADRRELVLASGGRAAFDVLLGVPPHRPPPVVRESGLGSETGFVPVDPSTLQTRVEEVFAVGDVTAIPLGSGRFLPKAGVFAHGEAEVVAERIADEVAGKTPQATFDGEGACFVEMGNGVAAYATGNFYAEGGPAINLRRPSRIWHLGKVAFEQYWLRRWF
jgi:sulfide:quinone oxidoreductase